MIGPKAYIDIGRLKQNVWNIRRNIGDRNLMIVVKQMAMVMALYILQNIYLMNQG